RFGAAVAFLGQDILVGAPNDDTTGEDAGAAYVFGPDYQSVLHKPITSPQGAAFGHFGATLAMFDGKPLVAAPGEDGVGRAYLFDPLTNPNDPTSTLIQRFDAAMAVAGAARVPNPNAATPRTGDQSGPASAASGSEIAFGAPADANNAGRVFLYNASTGKWRVITSSNPLPGDGFGSAVTFAGNNQIVIGAPGVAGV